MNLRQILEGCPEFLKVHKTFTEKKVSRPPPPPPFTNIQIVNFLFVKDVLNLCGENS